MTDKHKPKYDPELGDLTGPDFTRMSDDEIMDYWRNTTTKERFHEVERLRRITWGRKALARLDKTKIEIISYDRK